MAFECMEYVDELPQISYLHKREEPISCAAFTGQEVRVSLSRIDDWSRMEDWYRYSHLIEAQPTPSLSDEFWRLANRWKEDTWHISSIKKRISHPAYLQIIGMGEAALPYIFEDLRSEPAHWFWALEAITREDPSLGAQNMSALRDVWLAWAEEHGY